MKKTYVPKIVREKNWKGHVVLELYDLDKYLTLSEDITAKRAELAADKNGGSAMGVLRQVIAAAEGSYLKVDLTSPDGQKLASYADLCGAGHDGFATIAEIGQGLLNGFDEGNLPAPSGQE